MVSVALAMAHREHRGEEEKKEERRDGGRRDRREQGIGWTGDGRRMGQRQVCEID